ncbi:MAG: helix-turn-helix transcriptional regulator [Archangium sp.]|nr:helix-turn-helix transcriptional regulator [Archangium sp.]
MRNAVIATQVPARLKELRVRRDMSVRGLGVASGLPTEVVSRAERGLTTPSIGTLAKLCDGLGVSLGEFFSGAVPESLASVKLRRLAALVARLDQRAQDQLIAGLEGLTQLHYPTQPIALPKAADKPTRRR